jgi:DMSO/TMAO reductase YedYZ molybdopterin-dependent catalytic subunit
MKKFILPLMICLALLFASCQPAATTTTEAVHPTATSMAAATEVPAEVVLTVINLAGESKDFTLDDIKKLPAVEGQAGIKSSTGKITPPALFKGVLITELLDQAGGTDSSMGIEVEAKDGYAMTFSSDQIANGDFIAYDPGTGDETQAAGPLQVLLAYEMDGKSLDIERDGYLRLVVISEKNNQVTDGHWSIKWVRKLTIKQLAQEWNLALEGGIVDTLDRGSFESCSTGKCHHASWTDEKAQTWTGTPLWLIAGRMDDEIKHGDNSFNQALSEQGYTVEVIGKDGFSATFEIARLIGNNDIIVANQVNGNPLTDADFPLRLVGSDVGKKEGVGGIEKIILHFDQAAAAAPTATLAPTPVSAEPVSLPEGKALMITGLVEAEQTWSMDELLAMEVIQLTVEHPKKGKQDVEGVRLNALLDLAKVNAEAKQVIFTAVDGFTATADLQAVRDCKDCLVAFNESGALKLVMPGMESNFWVKDIIAFTIQ